MTRSPSYWRDRRNRLRGGPPRTPQPCGTRAAAIRHRRHGEQLCPACEQALREHQHLMYERRKAKK